ncbi:hypothetical protein C8J56DRAFT_968306 [Mycena floridula]|nr:hypothetical protein C8J56DRAFT_968306 [Mycena floridula]
MTTEAREMNDLIVLLTFQRDALMRATAQKPRTIPRDVLQEIFIRCLPAGRAARMNITEAPMLLCRICSNWRRIVLADTRLWSSLCLDVSIYTSNRERLQIENVYTWISRSGAQPLDIDINSTTTVVLSRTLSTQMCTSPIRPWNYRLRQILGHS